MPIWHAHQRTSAGGENATGRGSDGSGGAVALRSARQCIDTIFITMGERPSVEVALGQGTAKLYGSVGVLRHVFGDTTPTGEQRCYGRPRARSVSR